MRFIEDLPATFCQLFVLFGALGVGVLIGIYLFVRYLA
jgi:hypothetical protein